MSASLKAVVLNNIIFTIAMPHDQVNALVVAVPMGLRHFSHISAMSQQYTNDKMKALFLRVMDQMVQAGWLKSHIFTDGKGHHLVWTESGADRALCLKKISETYELKSDDRAAYGFDALAHGDPLPSFIGQIDIHKTLKSYWCESIAQLCLHGDQDGLLAFVHIVQGWAPDANTPVRFGP